MSAADYESRFEKITDHMEERLDEPLDVELLPEIAGLPATHWHRLYYARRGESVLATFSRLRLQRAAEQLTDTAMSLAEIAEQCGFRRLEAFTRIFERACGVSPSRIRRQGGRCEFTMPVPVTSLDCPITVEARPACRAVTLVHQGAFKDIGRSFDALHGWMSARGAVAAAHRPIGIFYDDPLLVAEADLQSRAGLLLSQDVDIEWPLEMLTFTARDYAVGSFTGPLAQLRHVYQWLYGEWIPESGRWLADEPVIEEYVSDPRGLTSGDIEIRVSLPLA